MTRHGGWRLALGVWFLAFRALAWDYELHRLVNQLALDALPADMPGFLREGAARERVGFLAGEPDRWRNSQDPVLRHENGPDHYFDIEDLDALGLKASDLSPFSGEYLVQVAQARAAQPGRFGAGLTAASDTDRTKWFPGLLPWRIASDYARLRSAWSYLKTFEAHGGTPAEIANARENVVYLMGVMGHFVGDAAQPLHTTVHFNGWVGDNPSGYTTNRTFHAWIDGGYLRRIGVSDAALKPRMRPARLAWEGDPEVPRDNLVPVAMDYVHAQFRQVEPLYRLDRDGALSGRPEAGDAGRVLLEGQLVTGAQMLADLWWSAWRQAGTDTYLRTQLARRKADEAGRVSP